MGEADMTKTLNKNTSRIGVLMGGLSAERKISLKSGQAVAAGLRSRGWKVVEIDVGPDLAAQLTRNEISHAWLALHGQYGEDGCVQGLLELMQIPYTGSGVRACAITMDKFHTKEMLRNTVVQMAKDNRINRLEEGKDFPVPCVVKDPTGGSSIGVWMCQTAEERDAAIEECLRGSQTVLLEEWIVGDEITVAVLDGQALPVILIQPHNSFFDLDAKYTKGKTDYLVPAPIPDEIASSAQLQAKVAYKTIGMRGIARADFLISKDKNPIFLEINAIPGMTQTSLSPMAANAIGISFDELVEQILEKAQLENQLVN